MWKSIQLRFSGSLKPSSSICYVLFSSEEKYFGALLLFHKIPLNLHQLHQPLFHSLLSVFPSGSDGSTHFHIETPSFKNLQLILNNKYVSNCFQCDKCQREWVKHSSFALVTHHLFSAMHKLNQEREVGISRLPKIISIQV